MRRRGHRYSPGRRRGGRSRSLLPRPRRRRRCYGGRAAADVDLGLGPPAVGGAVAAAAAASHRPPAARRVARELRLGRCLRRGPVHRHRPLLPWRPCRSSPTTRRTARRHHRGRGGDFFFLANLANSKRLWRCQFGEFLTSLAIEKRCLAIGDKT